jgi:hypothetical protein
MNSPYFSNFRELIDKWDDSAHIFLENDLCMFFKKNGKLYGATESSRITFARMKNPESKEDKSWSKEATFTVYDLENSSEGQNSMNVFGKKDLIGLEVITQEEAEKELSKKGKKMPLVKDDDDQDSTYGEK